MSPVFTNKKLAFEMLRIRMIEEAIGNNYASQNMRCPVHLSIGQEAVAVGVLAHFSKEDYAVSGHRAHAHYLAKGGDLKSMIAEIYGKKTGCAKGRGGSMHLVDLSCGFLGSTPIVGGSLPIGVGAAFATHLKNEKRITAIFFGEGATEEGVFGECLNFASLHSLPILFVCENNFYSVYSPLNVRQSSQRSRLKIAEAHGIATFSGDGNEVEEVFDVTKLATDHIKNTSSPSFVEFTTYRYREHCGPNIDPYQPGEESSYWKKRDPIRDYSSAEEIKKEIEEAFEFASNSPFPTYEQLLEEMYA